MIGNQFQSLRRRLFEALGKAIDSLSTPSAGTQSSFSLGGLSLANLGVPVSDLSALSAPVAAKGIPRGDDSGSKTDNQPHKDTAPKVYCDNQTVSISQAVWDKLNSEYRGRILSPQNQNELILAGVVATTLNQLYRHRADYINEAAARILNYRGLPKLLKQVFDTCGSYDPIALGKKLEVHVIPANQLSSKELATHYQLDAARSDELTLTVRSDAGAILTSTPHILTFRDDPARIVAIGGRQLMTSHSEALFGATPEVARVRRRRIEGNVGDSILAPLVGMSIDQILNSDDLLEVAKKSPLFARNLKAFQELMPMLRAAHSVIQNALFGVGVGSSAETVECLGLKKDAGGQLLSWCEANARTMPEPLQADLERLLHSPHEILPKEQQQIVARLATYRISHSTINLTVALGPLNDDLAALKALPKADPLYNPELEQAADAAIAAVVSSVSADSSNEIRLDRLPDLIHSPMTAFRKAVNQRELETYKEEFLQALAAFKPLFCEGDRFKEGFRGESVPLSLLSSTLYGANIGSRRFAVSSDDRFPALSRTDFYHLKEALFYDMVSSDTEGLCMRLSIPRFKEMVMGVVTAHRKATDLDKQYRVWHAAQVNISGLYAPPNPGEHLTSNIDVANISTFSPTVLHGGKICPAEEFARVYGIGWAHCIDALDVQYPDRFGGPQNWNASAPLERYLRDALLCDFGLGEKELLSVARQGKCYLSGPWCGDIASALEPYDPNPFIFKPLSFKLSLLRGLAVRRDIVERALILRGFLQEPDVQKLFAPLRAEGVEGGISVEDRAFFTEFLSTKFVIGEISGPEDKRGFKVKGSTGRELLGEPNKTMVEISSDVSGALADEVKWLDPSCALTRCREIFARSISTMELHTDPLVQEVVLRVSRLRGNLRNNDRVWNAYPEYARAYSALYDAVTWLKEGRGSGGLVLTSASREALPYWTILSDYPDRISREFIETIKNLLGTADAVRADGPIGTTGWFGFKDGIPVIVNGNKLVGSPLDEVLYSNEASYITRFLREKLRSRPPQLVSLIDQMIAAKKDIDTNQSLATVDDKKSALRSKLIQLCRDI